MNLNNLKTGEMLDRLGLHDTAISNKEWCVGYTEKGDLITWDKGDEKPLTTEGNLFSIYYPWMKEHRWRIIPQFVSYEEAMIEHRDNKKTIIYYQDEELQYTFSYGDMENFKQLASDNIELHELLEGKWIVVN